MASSNVGLVYFVRAAVDLEDSTKTTGKLYKAINVASGNIAESGQVAGGVIVGTAKAGASVTYTFLGVEKYAAKGTITANQGLTVVASGYFSTANSGDYIVGRALIDVASGSVGKGIFNFVTPRYVATCFDNVI